LLKATFLANKILKQPNIHNDEIGIQHYPQVIKLLAELIVDGLLARS
jgi:hypothetical protein